MGMIIEFNWFMVVANENKILEEQENLFYTIKSEKRIYPIGFQIPLIVKEKEVLELLSKVEVDLRELAHESKTDKNRVASA
jgi:hypothetical protein